MRHNGFSLNLRAILTFCTAVVFLTNGWAASHQVLHSFNPGGSDAAYPFAGLVADAAGNLYGTTFSGGTYNVGTVFEMSPQEGGGWTEKLLYSFNNNGQDGFDPEGSLIFDGAGNLYGTTQSGGIHAAGTAFELSPNGGGGWTETVLHSFGRGTDGTLPYAALVFDSSGNLYTTTQGGGIDGLGAVVELSPRQGGGWTETVIHSLGNGTDGYTPLASVILDAAGNLSAPLSKVASTMTVRCSSCRPGKAAAGRKPCCIVSETTATGVSLMPTLCWTAAATSMAPP